jgi:hypothetical protein
VERTYWLKRNRASIEMAQNARCSAARLAHYELAGRYGLNALAAEPQPGDLADAHRPAIYAGGSNPSFEDADNG